LLIRSTLLLSVSVLLLIVPTSPEKVSKKEADGDITCQKNVMTQLDQYLKEIELVPNGKRKFPETIGMLREACKIQMKVMSILTKLANKCMEGFKKNVLLVTLYSVKKNQKLLCRPNPTKEVRDFVAAGKCVNAGQNQFRKCLQKTQNDILKVRAVEDKLKIPLICCEIVRAKGCLLREAKKVSECKEEHIETMQNRFNNVAMNSMNLACGEYSDETDRCSRVHAPKGTVHIEKSNKSMVMTMFELLDNLPFGEDAIPGSPAGR